MTLEIAHWLTHMCTWTFTMNIHIHTHIAQIEEKLSPESRKSRKVVLFHHSYCCSWGRLLGQPDDS